MIRNQDITMELLKNNNLKTNKMKTNKMKTKRLNIGNKKEKISNDDKARAMYNELLARMNPNTKREVKLHIGTLSENKQKIGNLLFKTGSWDKTLSVLVREKKTAKKGLATKKAQIKNVLNHMKKEINKLVVCAKPKPKQDYTQGLGKANSRADIINQMMISAEKYKIRTGEILTLSGSQCIMEKLINKEFKQFTFLTCENNSSTFDELRKERRYKNLKFITSIFYGNAGEIIKLLGKNSIPHYIGDYCANFETFKEEVGTLFKQDIVVKGGIIVLTSSLRVGTKGYDTLTEMTNFVNKFGQGRYKIIYSKSYKDSMGMLTMIIRRMN